MNTQHHSQKWTPESLDYLKIAYLRGVPLKKMAAKLDRSVSAINKILSRHNFRTTHRVDYSFNITRKPSLQRSMQKRIEKRDLAQQTVDHPQIMGSLPLDYRFWTPFIDVIRWLQQNDTHVVKPSTATYYEVKGVPRSKEQILCMANAMREDQCLPVFWVRGITKE